MPGVKRQANLTYNFFGLRIQMTANRICWYGPLDKAGRGTLQGVTSIEIRRRSTSNVLALSLPFTGHRIFNGCGVASRSLLRSLSNGPWNFFVRLLTKASPQGAMQGTLNGGHYGIG
jgi:hypothetical protein